MATGDTTVRQGQGELIVVVDDDRLVADIVRNWLEEEGYEVAVFCSGEDCLAALSGLVPSAVCLDLHLPGLTGLDTLEHIHRTHPFLPVTFLTGETDVRTAVSAIQLGAFDYLVKPVDRARLMTQTRNAVEHGRMAVQLAQLQREVAGAGYPGLVGRSPVMRGLLRQMDRLSVCDTTVLIHGESGTGKELVARGIHSASGRRDGPFVALNCAAIPESLQEAELFGHEKGAFTGAVERRPGTFEQGDGGTVFLDEVGELASGLQAKLLRVLQDRRLRRVGGRREITSDFRLLAATNRDIEADVAAGRFRQDLFYRLAVFELEVPPLRDHAEDIPLLASHFVTLHSGHLRKAPEIAAEAADVLVGYRWPGNVRELENAVQHALVVAGSEVIEARHLPRRVVEGARSAGGAEYAMTPAKGREQWELPSLDLAELERMALVAAIDRAKGNLSEAGRLLGISRSTVYRKLRACGLAAEA